MVIQILILNYFPCNGGNCTWWAKYKRPDTGYSNGAWWGDAFTWRDRARQDGYQVGTKACVGSIAVLQRGEQKVNADAGHVAYVETVNGDGTFRVSEMSWGLGCNVGNSGVTQSTYKEDQDKVTFIYPASGCGTSPTPTPQCPSSGGVILYKDWNYDCGGTGEGTGWVRRDSTGWQNVSDGFNDNASSVRVPSGWSVKLFQDSNRGGGWACRTGDDNNFAGDQFNNGASLNDGVSSFEVFHDTTCGGATNRAPNTPSLSSPDDWYVAHDGRSPTLCWNNPGDPDGDHIQFYAEIYASARGANSGWQDGTCWRPTFWTAITSPINGMSRHEIVMARKVTGAPPGTSASKHPTNRLLYPLTRPTVTATIRSRHASANWTFHGTASDPENKLDRVEFHCSGDNCGSGVRPH